MKYIRYIPSMIEYAEKLRQLDPLDFKIIQAIYKYKIFNLSKLAKLIGIPQQTISYHVKKFDKKDLVRFRALIEEAKLGLKSYAVIASTSMGKENISSFTMTCFPLWRYLAIIDGRIHGNYVRYVIPPDKEIDLKAFLNELQRRELISEFQIFPTTSPAYPLINLDFYIEKRKVLTFDWNKWIKNLDSLPETQVTEPINYKEVKFDLFDLIILRCLEINARMTQRKIVKEMAKILKEKEHVKFIPLVSRRIRERIMPQGLIRGYRIYLFPNPGSMMLFLMYRLIFRNSVSLKKFLTGLNYLPYNTAYEKVLGKDELIVRFVIPSYECYYLRKSLVDLTERGWIKDAHLFLGDLPHATWDNVEIYQMYKNGTWNFSYGIAMKMLEVALTH